jgi:peptidoglycan/xylan/chitin deacetylase (PgdA/CDA1 family)
VTGAKLLFFWDYDTQWGADRSRSAGGPKDWGRLEFENTERLLDLHARYDVKACFAVVGAAALPGERPYHDPAQIRRIHAAGHEIASHSFYHEWLPGLHRRALKETLKNSKDALEQCISAPVTSFVPPFNQPFDYPAGLSFSLSERRAVRKERTDLQRLCETLGECGYRFCRVCYRPVVQRLIERLKRKQITRPIHPEIISGVTCLRLNTHAGFDGATKRAVCNSAARGGWVVVYGHPHALSTEHAQGESFFAPFLDLITGLRRAGMLTVYLPRDIAGASP